MFKYVKHAIEHGKSQECGDIIGSLKIPLKVRMHEIAVNGTACP
jgi:hypothetical protein